MLWALVVLLLLLWIGGFALNVAGGLIHLLLVLAVIVAIYNLVVSRGRTARLGAPYSSAHVTSYWRRP